MTDRRTLDQMNDDALTALYDQRDQARRWAVALEQELAAAEAANARFRERVQAAADEARGSMRDWLLDALSDSPDPREPSTAHTNRARAEAERELERAEAKVAEYENAITWHTNCTSCARVLDSCIRETIRAERAEAELARLTEAESADAAAGSYAHRAERAEAERDQHAAAVLAECDAMGQAMAHGHASLNRLRDHITRIRAALDTTQTAAAEGNPR